MVILTFPMYKRICFALAVLVLITSSCSADRVRSDLVMEDLLIEQSCFPPGWYVVVANAVPSEKRERRAEDAIGIWLEPSSPDLTGAGYEVYRYKSIPAARSAFDKWVKREFNSSSIGSLTAWEVPSELPYRSSVADRSRLGCHVSGITGTRICQFMGQYDEFMVIFYTGFGEQHMTYAALEHILQTIDERMTLYVKNGTD